jgi:hypothetical protein
LSNEEDEFIVYNKNMSTDYYNSITLQSYLTDDILKYRAWQQIEKIIEYLIVNTPKTLIESTYELYKQGDSLFYAYPEQAITRACKANGYVIQHTQNPLTFITIWKEVLMRMYEPSNATALIAQKPRLAHEYYIMHFVKSCSDSDSVGAPSYGEKISFTVDKPVLFPDFGVIFVKKYSQDSQTQEGIEKKDYYEYRILYAGFEMNITWESGKQWKAERFTIFDKSYLLMGPNTNFMIVEGENDNDPAFGDLFDEGVIHNSVGGYYSPNRKTDR